MTTSSFTQVTLVVYCEICYVHCGTGTQYQHIDIVHYHPLQIIILLKTLHCCALILFTGTGICMTYIPAVTLLANYFDKWKYIAFSASSTGVGIGTLILPQYIEWLLNEYGWRGTYILTAGR